MARRIQSELAIADLAHGASGISPLVTLSIGIATQVPADGLDSGWLLGQADQALYAAKHSGRNCFVSANNSSETVLQDRGLKGRRKRRVA